MERGRSVKSLNTLSERHSAESIICLMESPANRALVVAWPLVECAIEIPLLLYPEVFVQVVIHLAMVVEETPL